MAKAQVSRAGDVAELVISAPPLGLVEATVGLTPAGGGTQRLVARAGVARATELVMTGDVYPAGLESLLGQGPNQAIFEGR